MPDFNSSTRSNAVDLTGRQFTRWTVLSFYDKVEYKYATGGSSVLRWLCRCECGKEKIVRGNTLINGTSVSCGCFKTELQIERQTTHGLSNSSEYAAWAHMIQRCENPKCVEYSNYGGRGIVVCEIWHDFNHFIADMGLKPSPDLTIERVDVNGHYEPSNCIWDTQSNQQRNRRTNVRITWNGREQLLTDWCRELGIPVTTMMKRLDRWTLEEALSMPRSSDKGGWSNRRLRQ